MESNICHKIIMNLKKQFERFNLMFEEYIFSNLNDYRWEFFFSYSVANKLQASPKRSETVNK